jgi:hypothetical protein
MNLRRAAAIAVVGVAVCGPAQAQSCFNTATTPVCRWWQDWRYSSNALERATEEARLQNRRVQLQRKAADTAREYAAYNADVQTFLYYNGGPSTTLYLPQNPAQSYEPAGEATPPQQQVQYVPVPVPVPVQVQQAQVPLNYAPQNYAQNYPPVQALQNPYQAAYPPAQAYQNQPPVNYQQPAQVPPQQAASSTPWPPVQAAPQPVQNQQLSPRDGLYGQQVGPWHPY